MTERCRCPFCGREFALYRDFRNELDPFPDHNRDTSMDDGVLSLNKRIVMKPCESSQKGLEDARRSYRLSGLGQKRASFWREA